ncbi:MAG TPA: response regulator transcription factor [Gammaproteobacteria bacterium]|nr:response regulator transcription factor [Gammaproteobacteria bacterium]
MATRVILADDHKILRAGLISLLKSARDFEVVAEACNGRETVNLVRQLKPDIVVMDVAMPDMNGVEATRKITRLVPQVRVLALSGHDEGVFVKGMLEAGAKGYLLKDAATDELLAALKTVLQGRIYVSPSVTDTLVIDYLQRVKGEVGPDAERLTTREREVLQLVAEGKSTASIAAILHLSDRTIETHRKRIMDKLGIRSIAELTKYAIREGITSLHD